MAVNYSKIYSVVAFPWHTHIEKLASAAESQVMVIGSESLSQLHTSFHHILYKNGILLTEIIHSFFSCQFYSLYIIFSTREIKQWEVQTKIYSKCKTQKKSNTIEIHWYGNTSTRKDRTPLKLDPIDM